MDPNAPPPADLPAPQKHELLERTIHDLKNPLAVVRASLEWLEVELADREEALDAVRDASIATSRLLVIVGDLDLLARMDAGRTLSRGPVELGVIIESVTAATAERLAFRGITVVSLAPVAIAMKGESTLLARAIEALVEACVRGAPTGSNVEIEARLSAGAIEIEIGLRGTSATVASTSIDALENAGLGVYLAQRVAEAHGGSIRVIATTTLPRIVMRLAP